MPGGDGKLWESIAHVEVSSVDALTLLLGASQKDDPNQAARIYETLRQAVWKLVRGRASSQITRGWYDTARNVAAALEGRAKSLEAAKISALCDLLLESSRFDTANDRDELARRPHIAEILKAVAGSRLPIMRKALRDQLKLREANLTRILNVMVSAGLVTKEIAGREVAIALTTDGAEAVGRHGAARLIADPPLSAPQPRRA